MIRLQHCPKSDNPVTGLVNWGHSTLAMKSQQFDLVKMITTARKINTILLSIKIIRPKLANMCGYKLSTNWQNFMVINLAGVKILKKVLGWLLFWLTL